MKQSNKDTYVVGNMANFASTRGYLIGQFMGSRGFPALETEEVEVAWKHLPVAPQETMPHFHRRGVEVNIVISGSFRVLVNGEAIELMRGDFLVVYPETTTQTLEATEGTELIVVKAPSVSDDKYEIVK